MNKDKHAGNGKISREKSKDPRGRPIIDRLDLIAAKRDELEGEVQQAYCIIKDAAEKQGGFQAVESGSRAHLTRKVLH